MTGFESKREAAADKLQEPVNLLEARRIAAEYGTPDSQVDDGNLYFALSKCLEHIDAQPAQEPVAFDAFLESEDFYELMQAYRHFPIDALVQFEAVKDALRTAHNTKERNFCPRCGKRTNDIHTCIPPQ